MIQANELRIGNWVKDYTRKIIKIDSRYFCGTGYASNPIPLTPEVLEKCGFEKGKHYEGFDKNITDTISISFNASMDCSIIISDEENNTGASVVIKSLHQLQNLVFALTGNELLVVNLVSEDNNTVNI